jgi:hypothetical protein
VGCEAETARWATGKKVKLGCARAIRAGPEAKKEKGGKKNSFSYFSKELTKLNSNTNLNSNK